MSSHPLRPLYRTGLPGLMPLMSGPSGANKFMTLQQPIKNVCALENR